MQQTEVVENAENDLHASARGVGYHARRVQGLSGHLDRPGQGQGAGIRVIQDSQFDQVKQRRVGRQV